MSELQSRIKSAVLNYVNDDLQVAEYGHGFLVHMPIRYSDDDVIALFVEDFGGSYRVTDHGETGLRLQMGDIDLTKNSMRDAWRTAIGRTLINDIDPVEGHVSIVTPKEHLGRALFAVAEACSRVDQISLLARGPKPTSHADRVTRQVERTFRRIQPNDFELKTHARVPLRYGRERQVTAGLKQVRTGYWSTVIQAMAGSTKDRREEQLDKTYHIFDLLDVPKDHRIAVMHGDQHLWGDPMMKEIESVGIPVFLDEKNVLEGTLRHALHQQGFATA